jgi:hypothetical protein
MGRRRRPSGLTVPILGRWMNWSGAERVHPPPEIECVAATDVVYSDSRTGMPAQTTKSTGLPPTS